MVDILILPDTVSLGATIAGILVTSTKLTNVEKYHDYKMLSYASTPIEEVQVVLRFKKNSNLHLEIFDIIYERPESTAQLLKNARGPAATPAQNSDHSIVLGLVDVKSLRKTQ